MNRKSIIVIIMTFFAGLFAGNRFCKLTQYLKAKKIANELLEETAESIWPCELLIVTHYNQEEEFTIKNSKEILIYGYGSDGMVSASKSIIKLVGDALWQKLVK